MSDLTFVRAQHTCVRCGGSKNADLLLCWPCHRDEKRPNDGAYSEDMERRLAQFNRELEHGAAA